MSVSPGVDQKLSAPPSGTVELQLRHLRRLLDDSVGQNDKIPTVEEVEDSKVQPLTAEPQLVDSIREVARLRTTEQVPLDSQSLDAHGDVIPSLLGEPFEPAEQRHPSIRLTEQDNSRHGASLLIVFAILRMPSRPGAGFILGG